MDPWAHGGREGHRLEVGAFCGGWFYLLDSVDDRVHVFDDLVGVEGDFSDSLVDVGARIVLEGHLTALDFLNHLFHVWTNRVCLWVRHEADRTEDFGDLGHLGHHVRRSDDDVCIYLAFGSDFVDQVFAADEVSACFLGFRLFSWGDDGGYALGFTRSVREDDGSANLLFALFDVDTEVDVDLNGSVELGGRGLFDELSRFHWAVKLLSVDHLSGL